MLALSCGLGSSSKNNNEESFDVELTIDGDGFFTVRKGSDVRYTRKGAFDIDREGFLTYGDGYRLLGYQFSNGNSTTVVDDILLDAPISEIIISSEGLISSDQGNGPVNVARIVLAKIISTHNLLSVGNEMCQESDESGQPILTLPGNSGTGTLQTGGLEGSYSCDRRSMRVSISGNGYFRLNDDSEGKYVYTGEFLLGTDKYGNVVNESGFRLTGLSYDSKGNISNDIAKINIATINGQPIPTANVTIYVNLDVQTDITINPSFDETTPDITSHFSGTATVYDSIGNTHTVTIYYRKAKAISAGMSPSNPSYPGTPYGAGSGAPWPADYPAIGGTEWEYFVVVDGLDVEPPPPAIDGEDTVMAWGRLEFDSNGALYYQEKFNSPTGGFDFKNNSEAVTQNQQIDFDFGDDIAVDGGSGLTGTTGFATSSVTNYVNQDGYGAGTLKSITIDTVGIIYGHLSSGRTVPIAKFILAFFPDPSALGSYDPYTFQETAYSGPPALSTPGSPGYGTIEVETLP